MHGADDPITAAVFDFVEQFCRDAERGTPPDLAHYLARFPEHEHAVRTEYERLVRARADAKASPGATPLGRRVGPYEIVAELGRGGQGAVYVARDLRLAREVALKVLPPSVFVAAHRLKRFRREADLVASLSHPGICDVLDADFDGDVAYIAMRLVPGKPLSESIRSDAPPDRAGLRRAVVLIERAGRALHVAHEAGVVHRDVKPANIMVTPDDAPVILDFGLAHEVGDANLTEPGAVIGTLDYMAPEQLAESPVTIDRRADVYALAVTAFELVTGTRPFVAPSREVLARKIRGATPPDPRALNAAVPADLAVVLHKALEKEPARRYATALQFAEDLRRVVDFEPIHARPAGPWLKLRRWARRHPLLSTSTALAATLLTAGLIVTLLLLDSVVHERERYKALFYATHARKLVEQDPAFALLTAVESAKIAPSFQANSALYEILDACREEHRIVRAAKVEGRDTVALAADGSKVATIDGAGGCVVDSIAQEAAPFALPFPTAACCVAFDAAARHAIVGGADGSVALFDLAHRRRVGDTVALPAEVSQVALDARGQLAAARCKSGEVYVLDFAGEHPGGRKLPALGGVSRLAITADGERILTLADGTLRVHRSHARDDGAALALGGTLPVHAFAPAPSGKVCALVTSSDVQIVDLEHDHVLHRFPTRRRVAAVAFDPAGDRLAACERGRLTVWACDTGRVLLERDVHRNQILWDIAWSQDGRLLATAGLDNAAQVFSSDDGAPLHDLRLLGAHPRTLRFAAAGRRLVAAASNAHVIVYALDQRPGQLVLRGHVGGVHGAHFSTDGDRILSAADDGARVWDRSGRCLHARAFGNRVLGARWSADGQRAICVTQNGEAHLWTLGVDTSTPLQITAAVDAWFDVQGGALVLTGAGQLARFATDGTPRLAVAAPSANADPRPPMTVRVAAFDAARSRVAVGYDVPLVDVVDAGASEAVRRLPVASLNPAVARPQILALGFSPGGRYLAVGGEDTFVRLVDADSAREVGALGYMTPGCIAFDATASRLLVGGRFTNPVMLATIDKNGALGNRAVLVDHRDRITAVDFHPDGERFLTASNDGTVLLYRTQDRSKLAVLAAHRDAITAAVFSRDGTAILTASLDGTLRLWPVDPLALAKQRVPRAMTEAEKTRLARELDGQ